MLQELLKDLAGIFQNIRPADLLDILFIAAFLYFFINWIRKSASRRVIISITIFLIIYTISRLFELYLTELLIKSLFVLIVIATIIVFQSDIRRTIDLIGIWGSFVKKSAPDPGNKIIDHLAETLIKLSENKTGALIALKGKEPWDRPIHGGIPLDGIVTQPLLLSIFNTATPGHDGAVLIENERISKYAAHLTLSVNYQELGQRGTRHAAALGLSEQCDALVLVVSEERGTISIAESGKMTAVGSVSELKERISQFRNKHFSGQKQTMTWLKSKSVLTAALSFFISAVLWFLLAYQSDIVYRTFVVPIEWRNMQSNLEIIDASPVESRVTITGSEQAFRLLDPSALSISLDMERLQRGANKFTVADDNLRLPKGLKLYNAEPSVVKISAEQMKTYNLPVRVQTFGKLPRGKKLTALTSSPAAINIRLPINIDNVPEYLNTEPVDLSKVSSSSNITSRVLLPAGAKLQPFQNPEITIKISIR